MGKEVHFLCLFPGSLQLNTFIMEIRKKITYQFITIVAIILFLSLISIYISFSESRKEEFYDRLASKAKLVAQMLVEIDEIDTEVLRKIEKNNPLSLPNEKIIIYDYRNSIIYSSDEEGKLNVPDDLINKVRLIEEIKLKQKPYEIYGQFYTGQYDRIVVFAAATDIFGLLKLKRLRIILLIVFITSLIIVFFSGRLFAARSLYPISKIITQVDKIGVANLNERVDEGNEKDELARLANTFNKMLERLETAFKIQKNFIANASHELRTPLTAISGQLEVTLLKKRTNEEYHKTLDSVLEDIKNLNNVANRLLLLAQASSDFGEIDFSNFRIDDALWQAKNEIMKRNPGYSIHIGFDERIDDEEKLLIHGNDLLLKTAIGNLMDNACKYSSDNSVEVKLGNEDNMLSIKFTDNGIGISSEEIKMIFQPFYRSRNVMNTKGHGLGLSLVEKIVQLHKGAINLISRPGKGSEFTMILPISVK